MRLPKHELSFVTALVLGLLASFLSEYAASAPPSAQSTVPVIDPGQLPLLVQQYAPAAVAPAISAAIGAATPPNCSSVPPQDTLNGAVGIGTPCMPRPDATRPTAVQSSSTVTDASGNITVTFQRTMQSAAPSLTFTPQAASGGLPIVCNWITRSQTGFTAGCWQSQTTTLGAALTAIVGLVISPFKSGAAGTTVTWFAREPTQPTQ